jgi:hypothetical protein
MKPSHSLDEATSGHRARMLKSGKKGEGNGIHRIDDKRFVLDAGEGDETF